MTENSGEVRISITRRFLNLLGLKGNTFKASGEQGKSLKLEDESGNEAVIIPQSSSQKPKETTGDTGVGPKVISEN